MRKRKRKTAVSGKKADNNKIDSQKHEDRTVKSVFEKVKLGLRLRRIISGMRATRKSKKFGNWKIDRANRALKALSNQEISFITLLEIEKRLYSDVAESSYLVSPQIPDSGPHLSHNFTSLNSTLGTPSRKIAIVDSGTTYHIVKDKNNMARVTSTPVWIKGVGGTSKGLKGTLKDSELGTGIPGIWYKDLPVDMLISVEGLKRDAWETHFTTESNYMANKRSGMVLPIAKTPRGLPSLELNFEDPEGGFVCSPCCPEDELVCPALFGRVETKDTRPVRLIGATKIARQRHAIRTRIKNPAKRSRISKLLNHWRNCHFSEGGEGGTQLECHECLEFKGRKAGHKAERDERFKTKQPLLVFSTDFFGRVKPQSYSGAEWGMIFVCDCCGYAMAKGIPRKSDAPSVLESFIRETRHKTGAQFGEDRNSRGQLIFGGIHSDNEPVLLMSKSKSKKNLNVRFCWSERV